MAIARGAGTEIIRSHCFAEVDGAQDLIIGVQHHIYTVLSIVVHCRSLNATADKFYIDFVGWDAHGGQSAQGTRMVAQQLAVDSVFIWNDKFSFNGCEPTGISGTLNTEAEQDAIADQGTTTAQKLTFNTSDPADDFDVWVSFIDQNNA